MLEHHSLQSGSVSVVDRFWGIIMSRLSGVKGTDCVYGAV